MPLYPQGGGLYPNSIDNVLLADMPANTVKGRAAGTGTGDPQDLPMSSLIAASQGLSYRNILGRNGGFEVWQRGAGGSASIAVPAGTTSGVYTADGWCLATNVNQASVVGQTAGETDGSRYAALAWRNTGQTGVGLMILEYPLDTDEIVPARNSIVTLSFSARGATGWSPVGGTLLVCVRTGTGAPAKRLGVAYTAEANIINSSIALAPGGAMTRYTFTSSVVVPVGTTQACLSLLWTPVGTAGANDLFVIDDVQLEVGSVATPFERRPFESELLACRRHYWKTFPYNVAPAQAAGRPGAFYFQPLINGAATQALPSPRYPVEMRVSPTIGSYNPITAGNAMPRNHARSADFTSLAPDTDSGTTALAMIGTPPASSAIGDACSVHITADAGI